VSWTVIVWWQYNQTTRSYRNRMFKQESRNGRGVAETRSSTNDDDCDDSDGLRVN
jgi:hypothetical protein